MNKFKVLLLIAVVLLAVAFLQADEPELIITALDSLTLPMDNMFHICFPNGDIMFCEMMYHGPNLHVTTFWYRANSHQITTPMELGIIYSPDIYWRTMRISHIGDKTHIMFKSFDASPEQVLTVITLHQDTLTCRVIDEFNFDYPFSFDSSCAMVAEDVLVIALTNSLVYFHTNTGSFQTLLKGDEYHCDSWHDKQVRALPDGNFLYISDIYTASTDVPEVWVLFDSAGNHLFTQEIADPVICSLRNGDYFFSHPETSPQWFYLSTTWYDNADGWLECSYTDENSFHIHYNACPLLNENAHMISSFGEDKVIVRNYDDQANHYALYCYNVPLELNPSSLFAFVLNDFGDNWFLNVEAAEGFYFVPRWQDGFMHIWSLWAEDSPIVHEFSFPLQNDPVNILPSYHENKLRIVTSYAILFYQVDATVSNAQDTAVLPVNTLEIYPNPVSRNAGFTIQSDLKKPVELGVYNIRGQKVQTIRLDNFGEYSSNAADLQGLNSGIYLLKPLGKENLPTLKFVVLK